MRKKIIPKKPYKTHGHYVTAHAVYDMNKRDISKGELGYNLRKRPVLKTSVKKDSKGRPSYLRFALNRILSVINPITKAVCSVRHYRGRELRKEKRKHGK